VTNKGQITPRPEDVAGVYGFPQVTQAGLSGVVAQQTPWGLVVLIGVPQSPLVSSP